MEKISITKEESYSIEKMSKDQMIIELRTNLLDKKHREAMGGKTLCRGGSLTAHTPILYESDNCPLCSIKNFAEDTLREISSWKKHGSPVNKDGDAIIVYFEEDDDDKPVVDEKGNKIVLDEEEIIVSNIKICEALIRSLTVFGGGDNKPFCKDWVW